MEESPKIGGASRLYRVGVEIPDGTTINHGILPVMADGIHLNAEGQIKLGKMTASAVEAIYRKKP